MSKPLITDGLVAYYPFDGNAKDYSGNGFDGTWVGNEQYDISIINKAAKFDGKSYIKTNKNFTSKTFTFSTWCKFADAPATTKWPDDYQYIINVGSSGKHSITFRLKGNKIEFVLAEAGGSIADSYTSNTTITDTTKFYHIAVTFDESTKTSKLYINGKLDNSKTLNTSNWYKPNDIIVIGGRTDDPIPYFHKNGIIDEVYIFDRVLTEDEIRKLYFVSLKNVQIIKNPNAKKLAFITAEHLSNTLKEYNFPSNSTDKYAVGNGTVQLDIDTSVNYNLIFNTASFASVDTAPSDYVKVITSYGEILFQVPGNTNHCKVMSNTTPYEATVVFINKINQNLLGESNNYRHTNMYQIRINNLDKSENKIIIEMHTNESFSNEAIGYKLGSAKAESIIASHELDNSILQQKTHCDFFGDNSTIAYYPFDGNANDACGKYNGTWVGNEQYISVKSGQAAKFDGNSEIKINGININNFKSISFSFWMLTSQTSTFKIIGSSGDKDFAIEFIDGKNYHPYFRTNNLDSTILSNACINDGSWHHYVAIFDTNGGSLYRDGKKIGDVKQPLSNTNSNLNIGNVTDIHGNNYYFNGLIDDVRIFNRALSPEEIQNIYENKIINSNLQELNYIKSIKNIYSFTNNEVRLRSGSLTVKTEFLAKDNGLFLAASEFETTDSEFLVLNTLDFTNKKINLIIPGLCSNYLINNEKCSLEADMPKLEANKIYILELRYSINILIIRILDGQNKIFEKQFKIILAPVLSDDSTKFSFGINCYLPAEMGMYFNVLKFLREEFLYLGNQFINTSFLGAIPFDNSVLFINNKYNNVKINNLVNVNVDSNIKFETNSLNYRYYLTRKTPETVSQTDETSLKLFDLTLNDSYNLDKLVVLIPITVIQQSTDTSNWYPVITVGDTNPTEVKIDTGKINYSTFIKIIYDQNKNIDIYYLDLNETIDSFDFKLNWIKVNENPVTNADKIALQLKGSKTQASISSRGIYFFSDDIANKYLQKTTINTILPFIDSSYNIQSNILSLTDQ